MTEYVEVRLRWPAAAAIFRPDDGDLVTESVFKVVVRRDDPRLARISRLNRRLKPLGRTLSYGWDIKRRYTTAELNGAASVQLRITATFEPEGESCGTVYDTAVACPSCGRGRRPIDGLRLDLSRLPQSRDIAQSIAGDEWVVSQRLAEAIAETRVTGLTLHPVIHRREENFLESVALQKYDAGRELLRRARSLGYSDDSPDLWVWMQHPARGALLDKLRAEIDKRAVRSRPGRRFPPWYQVVATGPPLAVDDRTQFGVSPVDDGFDEALLPCGHVRGLNILSELFVKRDEWGDRDFAVTDAYVGDRRGVLVPSPLIVISQRFRQLLEKHRSRGFGLEVAHLV